MSVDYIVASLPAIAFGSSAPISFERFVELAGENAAQPPREWEDLEIQLRNALAEARSRGTVAPHPANGCSLYWRKRMQDAFAVPEVMKREEAIDRVWWDAAGELTNPVSPLGAGALATYAIRLKILIRRAKISEAAGTAAFDRLTASSKVSFNF